jgi:hypothetical protein
MATPPPADKEKKNSLFFIKYDLSGNVQFEDKWMYKEGTKDLKDEVMYGGPLAGGVIFSLLFYGRIAPVGVLIGAVATPIGYMILTAKPEEEKTDEEKELDKLVS